MAVARISVLWTQPIGLVELDAIEASIAVLGVLPPSPAASDLAMSYRAASSWISRSCPGDDRDPPPPPVDQTMLELQMLDITKEPIEIAPTAHYSIGGVWVRPEDHGADVLGLYAIGEASSGLHGAKRLGGNSLIELLVFGRIVGQAAASYSASLDATQPARRASCPILSANGRGRRAPSTSGTAGDGRLKSQPVADLMISFAIESR